MLLIFVLVELVIRRAIIIVIMGQVLMSFSFIFLFFLNFRIFGWLRSHLLLLILQKESPSEEPTHSAHPGIFLLFCRIQAIIKWFFVVSIMSSILVGHILA